MHIILRFTRHIEIHHEHHLVNVDAACQQVGGYNHFDSSGTEPADGFVALLLIKVGMDFGSLYAETAQVAGKVAHTMLRGGEHNHALPFAAFENIGEDFLLFVVVAEDGRLPDLLDRTRGGDFHLHGVFEDIFGKFSDFRGHRGRERGASDARRGAVWLCP